MHYGLHTPCLRFAACLATAHARLGTVRASAAHSTWPSPLRPCFHGRDLHPLVDISFAWRTYTVHTSKVPRRSRTTIWDSRRRNGTRKVDRPSRKWAVSARNSYTQASGLCQLSPRSSSTAVGSRLTDGGRFWLPPQQRWRSRRDIWQAFRSRVRPREAIGQSVNRAPLSHAHRLGSEHAPPNPSPRTDDRRLYRRRKLRLPFRAARTWPSTKRANRSPDRANTWGNRWLQRRPAAHLALRLRVTHCARGLRPYSLKLTSLNWPRYRSDGPANSRPVDRPLLYWPED